MHRLRTVTIVMLTLVAFGGKPALQTVAWIGMIVSYSQEQGFEQAIVDTFSGERPCCLCTAIAASERDGAPAPRHRLEQFRLEAMPGGDIDLDALLAMGGTPAAIHRQEPPAAGHAWQQGPPVPPPRRGAPAGC